MGDKVKPWHSRKPKHGKKLVGLRNDDRRISPLRVRDYEDRIVPLRVRDYEDVSYEQVEEQ